MSLETATSKKYERILMNAVRVLSPDRAAQLVDFARYLEAQMLNEELLREEDPEGVEAENAQWDTLLASDKSQRLLDKLAAEAQAEYQAGKTRPLTFDDKP